MSRYVILVPFYLAALFCSLVAAGQAFGLCTINCFPEAGETVLGYYAMLFASIALPTPILVLTLAGIQRLVWYARG